MSKPCITLIAGSLKTKKALQEQLLQLLGEYMEVKSYAIDDSVPQKINEDIILYSSKVVQKEAVSQWEVQSKYTVVGKRTINHEYIDQLLQVPKNSKVLLVNDNLSETVDFIETLYQLGINHVQFVPFRKEQLFYEDIDYAISPGETHLCPPFIKNIIDIHVRLFDMATILKVVEFGRLNEEITSRISERYIRNIIDLQRKLLSAEHATKELNEYLHDVVDTVDDGILAINQKHDITVFNRPLEALFQITAEEVINRPIVDVLDKEFSHFILNGIESNKFFTINGIEVVIYRFQMPRDQTIVSTFKSVNQAFEIEKTAQRQLRKKGLYAKYDMNDIIGEHPQMKHCKQIAKKLSSSEHPILIQGETGTGKELFANAMHLLSKRKSGPFVAINVSALTESLLESELFGYEEGAFTGAQKGGKKGLFELADNGTIFLDEIGDISMTLQAHLLRVLQEGEIRRIGGNKIIPINVRIIAATNKNIKEKMLEGTFRPDLFYRLNVLNMVIPSLRERRSDIPLLVEHFIKKSSKSVEIDPTVLEKFMLYEWYGNIRELKSSIDYMLTVCENNYITLKDIPNYEIPRTQGNNQPLSESVLEMQQYCFILNVIKQCNDLGKSASRDWISEMSMNTPLALTPQQVRGRLNYLEKQGFIIKGKGRAGTNITSKGLDYLNANHAKNLSTKKADT